MPTRAYSLDTGFDTNPVLPPSGDTPPKVTDPTAGLTGAQVMAQGLDKDIYGAAFRMENDVINFVDLMSRPLYKDDPSFNLETNLKEAGMWSQYRWNYIGVNSAQEFLDVTRRISREEKDRALLASTGLSGFVAMTVAGLASPVNLLPFVGPGVKGAKAVAVGAGYGLLGGLAQEIPLQLNQETRTLEESIGSVAMSTVIGGVLGGAVGFLNRPLQDIADDMADTPDVAPIPPSRPQGVGAEAAPPREGAGSLKSAFGQENEFLAKLGPVQRVLSSASKQGQWMMAQLADAGLQLAGNVRGIATSVGGTAENNILTHWAKASESIKTLDDAYARYFLGKQGKSTTFDRLHANTVGQVQKRAKLSKREFKVEVAKALRRDDSHEIPEVAEVAGFVRKTVYDPLFEEAKKLGIYDELKLNEDGDVELVGGDLSYLNRDYDLSEIGARRPEFIKLLSDHFAGKLQAAFQTKLGKLLEKLADDEEMLTDAKRPLEEVTKLREEFLNELKGIDDARTSAETYVEDAIADLRSMGRDKNLPEQMRKDARAKADLMEGKEGRKLEERKAKRKAVKKRLSNLNRSYALKTKQHGDKLDRIGRLEEMSLTTLNRTVRAAQRVLARLETASDEGFTKEITELKNRFASVAQMYDKGEERITKLAADETVQIDELIASDLRQHDRAGRLSDIAEELDTVESIDREALRVLIQEGLDESLAKVNRLNGRRYARAERLSKEVEELDPKKVEEQIAKLTANSLDRRAKFMDDWQTNGAKKVELREGFEADFSAHAKEIAETVTRKIQGTNARLAGHDLIMEPKGAELARVLDIPSERIESFLNNDVEHLVSQYIRTLAPDIEIRKKLGEYAPDMGRNYEFQKLNEEEAAAIEAKTAELTAKKASPDKIKQENLKIEKEYRNIRRDMEAVIGRLRHSWGVPKDPLSFASRAGRLAMNINVLRYMNMVTVSSIPDLAQPILKYGLMRTFRDGWVPFVKGMAKLQFTKRELNLMGASIDMVMHSRAMAIADIGDYMVRGSRFEKGVEYAANKIGLIAAFDVWTTAMKQITGSVANASLMDDLRQLMDGKAGPKTVERLAASGINEDLARAIWTEVRKPNGSEIVDGVLWPNTEAWDDSAGAVQAYRAAVLRDINRTIITPGVERPLMMDSTLAGRILFQFKSFGMSSTTKTTLASLQQRDMAAVQGTAVSLALGALSYYIWANITGGKALEDMNRAVSEGNWGKFADEAISRSGVLGALSMGIDIASTLDLTAPYVSASGERLTRQADNDFIDAIGGPTVDLLRRAHRALPQRDAAGDLEFSRNEAHQVRLMMPFQNHFLLRQAYDAIERAIPE